MSAADEALHFAKKAGQSTNEYSSGYGLTAIAYAVLDLADAIRSVAADPERSNR